ncbi:hypothetical protein LOK49_LG04G03544 [Camellia lanceoleosa]|uniref:Uncharacterized protein n=1 Tax=Camellia lanceoleosa TaxID=1840588 RepID=A0ACC0HXC9_9ERIC|nr:hypothetical protein LOK49_LG04G03544 [Camellia lanceoleosa]
MAASRWFRQIDDGFAMVQTELRDGDDGVERSRWSRSTTALRDRDELRLRDGWTESQPSHDRDGDGDEGVDRSRCPSSLCQCSSFSLFSESSYSSCLCRWFELQAHQFHSGV